MRNQPITRVRAKLGVELDRERARRREWEAGGGEKALLLSREDVAKEKAVVLGAAQLERRDLGQVEEGERSEKFWREGKGGDCVILFLVSPRNPRRSPGGVVGNLAPKAEKDGEEVSHSKKSSKLTQQGRLLCDLE